MSEMNKAILVIHFMGNIKGLHSEMHHSVAFKPTAHGIEITGYRCTIVEGKDTNGTPASAGDLPSNNLVDIWPRRVIPTNASALQIAFFLEHRRMNDEYDVDAMNIMFYKSDGFDLVEETSADWMEAQTGFDALGESGNNNIQSCLQLFGQLRM
jgi:hypothetical protein